MFNLQNYLVGILIGLELAFYASAPPTRVLNVSWICSETAPCLSVIRPRGGFARVESTVAQYKLEILIHRRESERDLSFRKWSSYSTIWDVETNWYRLVERGVRIPMQQCRNKLICVASLLDDEAMANSQRLYYNSSYISHHFNIEVSYKGHVARTKQEIIIERRRSVFPGSNIDSTSKTESEYDNNERNRWKFDSELLWPIAEDDKEPASRSDFTSKTEIKPEKYASARSFGKNTGKNLPKLYVGPDGEITEFHGDDIVASEDDEAETMEFVLNSDLQNTSSTIDHESVNVTEMESDKNFEESNTPEWNQETYSSNYSDIISNVTTNTTAPWYQSVEDVFLKLGPGATVAILTASSALSTILCACCVKRIRQRRQLNKAKLNSTIKTSPNRPLLGGSRNRRKGRRLSRLFSWISSPFKRRKSDYFNPLVSQGRRVSKTENLSDDDYYYEYTDEDYEGPIEDEITPTKTETVKEYLRRKSLATISSLKDAAKHMSDRATFLKKETQTDTLFVKIWKWIRWLFSCCCPKKNDYVKVPNSPPSGTSETSADEQDDDPIYKRGGWPGPSTGGVQTRRAVEPKTDIGGRLLSDPKPNSPRKLFRDSYLASNRSDNCPVIYPSTRRCEDGNPRKTPESTPIVNPIMPTNADASISQLQAHGCSCHLNSGDSNQTTSAACPSNALHTPRKRVCGLHCIQQSRNTERNQNSSNNVPPLNLHRVSAIPTKSCDDNKRSCDISPSTSSEHFDSYASGDGVNASSLSSTRTKSEIDHKKNFTSRDQRNNRNVLEQTRERFHNENRKMEQLLNTWEERTSGRSPAKGRHRNSRDRQKQFASVENRSAGTSRNKHVRQGRRSNSACSHWTIENANANERQKLRFPPRLLHRRERARLSMPRMEEALRHMTTAATKQDVSKNEKTAKSTESTVQPNKHKEKRSRRQRDERTSYHSRRTAVGSVHSSEIDEALGSNTTDSYSAVMTEEAMKSSDDSNISVEKGKMGKTGKYRLKLLPTKQNKHSTRSGTVDTNLTRNRRNNVSSESERENISSPMPSVGVKLIQALPEEKSSQKDDDFLSAPCTPRDLECSVADKTCRSQTLTMSSAESASDRNNSSARALHSITQDFLREDDEELMLGTGEVDIDNDEFWKQTL